MVGRSFKPARMEKSSHDSRLSDEISPTKEVLQWLGS
jgi:hypothetical protein